MSDLFLTENGLSEFYKVDRKRIHKLLEGHEPDEVNGKIKRHSAKKVAGLLLTQESERGFQLGFNECLNTKENNDEVDEDESSYKYQKWRETKARADKLELTLELELERVAPLEAVIERDRIVASVISSQFDSLPAQIKRSRPDIPDDVIDILQNITAKSRNELDKLIQERLVELEKSLARQAEREKQKPDPDQE